MSHFLSDNLKPDEDSRGGGGCALRRDTLAPSRWRKPIRAGSVKFSQASSAALLDLVAVGDYRRSLIFPLRRCHLLPGLEGPPLVATSPNEAMGGVR